MSHAAACLLRLLSCFCVLGWMSRGESEQLIMTQIVYRHGDRSPYGSFPTNPVPSSVWPEGFQQLTQKGMKQHYELGKYFRKRYMLGQPCSLLNQSYIRDEIRIQSTDFDRTLMSAYSNLAGMYPPAGDQVWTPDIKWQPIPVHTEPLASDHLLNVEAECPRYDQLYDAVLRSDEVRRVEEDNAEFYAYLCKSTGEQEENITTIWQIYDTLLCQERHGFPLPEWAHKNWTSDVTVYERLHWLVNFQFDIMYNRPGEQRLRGGSLLGELTKNMLTKLGAGSNSTMNKTFVYSAHDDTVTAIMSAMGVFNGIAPPYASALLVELVNVGGANVVRLLYKNESTHDPYTLRMPDCVDDCPLEKFVQLTTRNVPLDWKKECRAVWRIEEEVVVFYLFAMIMSITAIFCFIYASAYLVFRLRRRRSMISEEKSRLTGYYGAINGD